MSTTAKYYSTCEECPLSVFISCLQNDDPKYLRISGTVPAEELSMAWATLYSEFMDLTQDNEQMYVLHLQREIFLVAQEIDEVETTLYFLQPACLYLCDAEARLKLLNILKGYDYPHEIDFTNEHYPEILEVIDNLLSSKRLRLEMKVKEMNDYVKERGADSFDKNYFYRQLARLAKYQGVAIIRPKDITVLEFVIIDKEYQQAHTKIENEQE